MKNIVFVFLLLSTMLFAQQTDKKWSKVIAYENDGKIKSANEVVAKIYKKAIATKDEVQMIKCFFYQSKYLQVVEENAKIQILKNLKTDIARVSIPSKAILHLIYAKCLSQYTPYEYATALTDIAAATIDTLAVDSTAIASTDTPIDFTSETELLATYEKTLENEALLKATPLSNYQAIFDFLTLEKLKNQNLYQYLLKENIDFFSQRVASWEVQNRKNTIYINEFLGTSEFFMKLDLNVIKDENLRKVLSLYQKQELDYPSLENQFDRIKYCHTFLTDSDDQWTKSLNELLQGSNNILLTQKIQLEKADVLIQQASKETHPDYNIEALKILDSIIKADDQSNTAKTALIKKYQLRSKSVSVQLQKYSYNNENTRAFIGYKNVDRLTVSFFKINQKDINNFIKSNFDRDSLATSIVKKQSKITAKEYQFQNKKDYFDYNTEVVLPQLTTGSYLVYFESDSDSEDKKAFTYETITVSNISVLASQQNKKQTFQVLDRKTGKPIENVIIKSTNFSLKTNSDGIATSSGEKNNRYNNPIEFSIANDTILINKNFINYNQEYVNKNKDLNGKVEIYLDRAIYRPGQTVYYKGIAIQKQDSQTSIVANTVFNITIRNANYQIFKEFKVTTNEFGSFSGEFALAQNGLTGRFTISAIKPEDNTEEHTDSKNKLNTEFWKNVKFEQSEIPFNVEEYKRPKFEITFDPKKESFQINQSITVTGTAKAFAGSNISDAKVRYTVTRFTSYFRNYYGQEQNEIIATGETITDASGKFAVDFIALPPKNALKEQLPVFSYRINASITDSNGETHTSETIVKVGYHDLLINTTIADQIETKDKNKITLTTTNLNGEFLATKGEIKMYFVSPFSNKFKASVWPKPEIETLTADDFQRLFPYEIRSTQTKDKFNETLVFTKKIDTQKDKEIALDFISNYKSGNYKVVFSAKDSFNNPIESISDFTIKQSKDQYNPSQLFTVEQINSDPKKDGFVEVKITSVIPDLYITSSGNYQNQKYFENTDHLQNHELTLKIPIKKEFEKFIRLAFESIFENEIFTTAIEVTLKSEEAKLEWITESFRTKIEPGSSEKWSFKLKSSHAKNQAEVLASMYDISLDQFAQQDWDNLNFNRYDYNTANFRSRLGFEKTYSSLAHLNKDLVPIFFRNEETKLKWFGFDFSNSSYGDGQPPKITSLKEIKVGSETIKGDPDAISSTRKSVAGAVPMQEDNTVYNTAAVQGYLAGRTSGITITGLANPNEQNPLYVVDGEIVSDIKSINPADILSVEVLKDAKATALYGTKGKNGVILITTKRALEALTQVKVRKNLSETAFFLPNLRTDTMGNVSFNFTAPEALSAWKLRLFAHNKEAVSGYLEKTILTQKELMVLPNFPRFFREKDTIVITAKISNITANVKTGIAILQFFDATTMQPVDAKMGNAKNVKNFTVGAMGSTTASWTISIAEGLQGLHYKILAKSGNFSDGEENILPVLTNNMLVTESIPIWVRENSTKEYTFENLKKNNSTTLKNHQFTLEYTSNPSWIAIQSLPYLMEYEHECAEQTFARFYANALASEIISSNPKIATVFDNWRKNGKLNSKLEDNEELKSIILSETPWIKDAQTEEEKKKNLALLFDLEKMKTSQGVTFEKLKQKQKPSGAFSWFDGSDENPYITTHILAGLGHLSKLNKTQDNEAKIDEISKTAIPFLDHNFLESYKISSQDLKATPKLIWTNSYSDLHYLYTRSFYLDQYPLSDTLKKATKIYLEAAKKDWLSYSLYGKGLAALTLHRFGESATAKKILASLKESSSNNEDWGMYWIANKAGWYWYQAPIETQALLIEAFDEVNHDTQAVDAMKVWLLKNKQTKNWPTTKSTTEAIYALLLQGNDWLSVKDNTIIKIGNEKILTKKLAQSEKEAETGYIKLNWKQDEVKKDMASISIQNKSKVPGFGGIYWQYFEDLDKVKTNSGAVLSVSKELYLKKNSLKGDQLERITTKNPLKIGDLVTIRLSIHAKEDMEFVHLKDMRASCFEPVQVLSAYQYKDALGYYRSTKDAATHFFFDQINKGTYIIEYDIRVNNSGQFSNGLTTIESMYAPEFSSHTKGIRVKVTH
jgi:TonB-dependent SusC/RagA subfamily outer membrane receptor